MCLCRTKFFHDFSDFTKRNISKLREKENARNKKSLKYIWLKCKILQRQTWFHWLSDQMLEWRLIRWSHWTTAEWQTDSHSATWWPKQRRQHRRANGLSRQSQRAQRVPFSPRGPHAHSTWQRAQLRSFIVRIYCSFTASLPPRLYSHRALDLAFYKVSAWAQRYSSCSCLSSAICRQ